ncbi:MAG: hypothetical protein GY926_03155 [bacterium]|nr:hypothetical protein [bacterium]MCP4964212.1 hypothetical protein [bacterium]
MISSELHRLADDKVFQSDALRRDADRLRSHAAALHGLLSPLIATSHRVWTGPAATAFEVECALHARQLDEQARRIVRIAGEFEEEANALRRQAGTLRAQAAALAVTAAEVGVQR